MNTYYISEEISFCHYFKSLFDINQESWNIVRLFIWKCDVISVLIKIILAKFPSRATKCLWTSQMEELKGSETCQNMSVVLLFEFPREKKCRGWYRKYHLPSSLPRAVALLCHQWNCPSFTLFAWYLVTWQITGALRCYATLRSDCMCWHYCRKIWDVLTEVIIYLYCWLLCVIILLLPSFMNLNLSN